MKVAYIVPTVTGGNKLAACLNSIRDQIPAPEEVVVVGNGWKGTVSESGTRTLSLLKNVGFTRACNLGIIETTAPFIALVNDDVILPPGWAETLLHHLQANPERAAASGVSVSQKDGRPCAGSFWNARYQAVETDQPSRVEFLNFAAVMIPRAVLAKTGLFPGRYHSYYEDVDFSLRLRARDLTFHVDPELAVDHLISSSSHILGDFRWFLLLRNRYWTLVRHYGTRFIFTHFPVLLRGDLTLWKKLFRSPFLLARAYAEIPAAPRFRHA